MSIPKRTTIIAEVGVNHNGDENLARKIVDSFIHIDLDFFKFQTYEPGKIAIPSAPMAEYQINDGINGVSAFDMLDQLYLSHEEFVKLKTYIEAKGKKFLSTGFDADALHFLSSTGATTFKVPSGEITNLPYLRLVASLAGEVLLSTGMSHMKEIEAAVEVLTNNGIQLSRITILQCNSAYPSPVADSNINAMVTMGKYFGTNYGYSDHTLGSTSALAAVALGASVIEKHITIDRNLPGPDHKASMEVEDFHSYVNQIREMEEVLGNPDKNVTKSEVINRNAARRGIYAAGMLKKGEKLSACNMSILRPETTVSPMEIDSLIGKTLLRDLNQFDPIRFEDVI